MVSIPLRNEERLWIVACDPQQSCLTRQRPQTHYPMVGNLILSC